MNGATGAGPTGTSSGTDGGGRGSAARAADPHTTNLKAIKPPAKDASSSDRQGSQGGTVTDTRGPQAAPDQGAAAQTASPLPGERQPQQQAGPYHPPQAYPAQAGTAAGQTGAVRRPRTGASTTPRVRKARLRVAKADPWSVMKVSFLLSIALGICTIVASAVLWMVMDAMGVFSTVGGTIAEATGSNESNGFDLQSFLSLPNVLMFTSIIAVIDVVLATALATLGAFIYNLSAGFVGGVEVTLAEDE
ncbi:membrane protein [Streptomyces malachitofuscus]|nr:membrane protein [Streptomyces malachitofuscus]